MMGSVSALFVLSLVPGASPLPDDIPVLSPSQVAAELRSETQRGLLPVRFSDGVYTYPAHGWLTEEFLPFFKSFVASHELQFEENGFDDDNFAQLFRVHLNMSNFQAGRTIGEVACGVMEIPGVGEEEQSFLNRTPGAERHRIVVRSDDGWFVVDPDEYTLIPLALYAADQQIRDVDF